MVMNLGSLFDLHVEEMIVLSSLFESSSIGILCFTHLQKLAAEGQITVH
jgi:hypothetical protein